ncbi:hypothetical protein [Geminisphaera colitermitum]|uniref:hypothetical protein n=1 Tax=Geminisphaera colitermitum TaxID=1148786 RepID=UPI000158CB7D|nr:hypothetical protein [Geminisphaera colitermitum]
MKKPLSKPVLLLLLLLLSALTAQAAVNFVTDETNITINPGDTFSVTLRVEVTNNEPLNAFDFFWKDANASGKFSLIGRDITGSPFTFLGTPVLPPSSLLNPVNSSPLGAALEDYSAAIGNGMWLIGRYSFLADASAVGSYVLQTYSQPGDGWVSNNFTAHELGQHASVTITVAGAVPEPATSVFLAAAIALTFAFIRRRHP